MNSSDEEFSNSDAWLSEQLFAQIKDFNAENKNQATDGTDEKIVDSQNLDIIHFDNFDSAFHQTNLAPIIYGNNMSQVPAICDSYDMALSMTDLRCDMSEAITFDELMNAANAPMTMTPDTPLFDLDSNAVAASPTTQLRKELEDIMLFPFHEPKAEMAAVVEDDMQHTPEPFNIMEGQNLFAFLDTNSQQMNFIDGPEQLVVLKKSKEEPQEEVEPVECPTFSGSDCVLCDHCNNIFEKTIFKYHVCDFDECHNLINPPMTTYAKNSCIAAKTAKVDAAMMFLLLPTEPTCVRLLRENQIRIRRFAKEELKFDMYSSGTNNSSVSSNMDSSNDIAHIHNVGNASSKKQDGPHECSLCERKFVHASGLLRHMEKHALDLIPTPGLGAAGNSITGGRPLIVNGGTVIHNINGIRVVIKCTLCGRIFFDPKTAFSHLCSHFPAQDGQEQELENCSEIPYEAFVDDALQLLLTEANDESVRTTASLTECSENKPSMYLKVIILSCMLQCEFCDFIFSDVSYLFVHSACHLPERRFECFACDICMRTSKESCAHWQAECVFMRETLKMHQVNTQRYFVCNVCESKFQSLDQLHEHRYTAYHFFPRMSKFLGGLKLPCEYCEAIFENAHDCVMHYEQKHYKKYKRDKDVSTNSNKVRQYLCEICGKSYTQSSHLWQHLRFHQGVKPFACQEPGCSRKFTIRPDLNDHIRKCHTGERPYHCMVCGKRFLTGSVFYQHRLIHRGERRYECEECGKRFYRADALKNHTRIHTGEKPFGCLFCTKNFRQRGDRDKHIRARHSHLDANTRLMMQMQKIQLEKAAKTEKTGGRTRRRDKNNNAAQATKSSASMDGDGNRNLSDTSDGSKNNKKEVVVISNVVFPKEVFDELQSNKNGDKPEKI